MPAQISSNYSLITEVNPDSSASELYRSLGANIRFAALDEPVKLVLVASVKQDPSKSEMIANLAVTYALEKRNVLLIDANLRKPELHRYFQTEHRIGLTDILSGQQSFDGAVAKTKIENVSLITAGALPFNPSEMLSSKAMNSLLNEAKAKYDVVLIDCQPILEAVDAQVLSAICDGVVVLVNSGKVKRAEGQKAIATLTHAKARILGAVLNNYNL
ncbi:CpsD/CapB family tyrosine-protein kinase [Paenibacillus chartarius]|uniref:non-specific protein-tyrosine kinase n=1 Tax=Paenibacillus chartarius TaxID=747481 RepID=A0ABV6DKP1_9BACL